MSWNWNSHGLPFLPGYTFEDVTKSAFHKPQTLAYKNGYALPLRPTVGIGQSPLLSAQLRLQELKQLPLQEADSSYDSYDSYDLQQCEDFIPAHVALDKKVLRFFAFFTEDVLFSPDEQYRVRPVVIYYFLEDDTMSIIEPSTENSGIPQGKRIKRQRLPKSEFGDYYTWTDLNVAMELEVYGVKYHVCDCDAFTKEFLTSEGIILNEPEPMPSDPYTIHRNKTMPYFTTPSDYDNLHQFHTMDRKVLRFFALWDDSQSLYGDKRPVIIHYYLVDDTIEVREEHEPNSSFPTCVLEMSKAEVQEYFSPQDFQLARASPCWADTSSCATATAHQTLLPDKLSHMELRQWNGSARSPRPRTDPRPRGVSLFCADVPPYNGFGSLEDSLQNCLSLLPEPKPGVALRKIVYSSCANHLADDMISIYEKSTRNSGIIGGKFLQKTRIPKPGSTTDNPQFYSPQDFIIGATVQVFGHRFVLTQADRYVLTYLESIQSHVPIETLESLRGV
ncbi:hypothetical protein WMY93_032518 [Mugilogobius chulae]|uniref:DM10 domain-containing protein n=1 Tax=Mugilogobius chulae TaxID=88201 RepID=A0AAW0MQM2_9GOBI